MRAFLVVIVLIVLTLLAIYFLRKLMETIVNMWYAIKHKRKPPYHEGMVLNKKTGNLRLITPRFCRLNNYTIYNPNG